MKNSLACMLWLFLVTTSLLGARAVWSETKPIPRKILAFYESKLDEDIFHTYLHRYAEMPLNYLGLEVVYRPIEQTLPADADLEGVRGILTWFRRVDIVPNPKEYCSWLTHQMAVGRKVVILGEPGVIHFQTREMVPECQAMMKTLGAAYQGESADNPFFFELVSKDASMVEFERKLSFTEGLLFNLYRPVSAEVHSYLKIRRRDLDDSTSSLVFTSPQGGFAHRSYIHYLNRELDKVQWRLNPFRFFEEAFQTRGLPRPDTTTLNGKRIFFSHIDGDGVFNVSLIDRKSFSGEIVYDKILKKYPSVPITASLITGYFDIPEYAGTRALDLYRHIFSLPNVQPAAHGYAHPLVWKKEKLALKISGYNYNPEQEISGSLTRVNDLLRSLKIDKQTDLYQWTGDCLLTEDIIARSDQIPALNINGGDSRYDKKNSSYAYVSPLGILKGTHRQIYAAASNENTYTNLWHGPYYRFNEVIETFKNTESPIRLKPIDIYYHYYSGERIEALTALTEVYDYALAQEIFPITTHDYAQMAQDFFRTTISPLTGGFQIRNNGLMRTIRFDREARQVDLNRSKGVLGFNHFQGNLYVFLDEAKEHEIYLTAGLPTRPYVRSASFWIKDFQNTGGTIHFVKSGWNRSELQLGGVPAGGSYRITADGKTWRVKTDSHGILSITFEHSEWGGSTEVTIDTL